MSFAVQPTFPEDFVLPVLHTGPTQLGRAVRVSSKLHLALDFWRGVVTLRHKLLSPPHPAFLGASLTTVKLLVCAGVETNAHESG